MLRKLKIIFRKLTMFIGFSSFYYKFYENDTMHRYRVDGWYFVYTTTDGERDMAPCKWWNATHTSGAGVCGCIVAFEDIISTTFKFKNRWFHRKYDIRSHREHCNDIVEKKRYQNLITLPKGLTSKEVTKLSMNRAIAAAKETWKNNNT